MPGRTQNQLCWLATALAMPCPLLVLILFATLREQPDFWHNSGGWPVWLRDLVLVSFYPLLAGSLCILGALSAFALLLPGNSRTLRAAKGIMLLGLWLLATSALAIAFANNVVNLWNGHPLHSHRAF
jgi:hypothetical protein